MRVIATIHAVKQASKRWPTKREITTPHSPALAIHTRFAAGCRHTTNTQSPNSYQLGFFLPVPPVKTAMTSRASRLWRRDFQPDSRKFLSLLSAGTRALATPLRVFSMTYRQQVREVIWSGGGELEKGLALYARIHAGSCGLRRRPWRRYSTPFSLSVGRFSPFRRPLKSAKSSSAKYNTALNQ